MQAPLPLPMHPPGFLAASHPIMGSHPMLQTSFPPNFGQPMSIPSPNGPPMPISPPTSLGAPVMIPPAGGFPLSIPGPMPFPPGQIMASPASPGMIGPPMHGFPQQQPMPSPPLQPYSQSAETKTPVPKIETQPQAIPVDTPQDWISSPSSQNSSLQMSKALHHSYSSLPDTYSNGQTFDPYSDTTQGRSDGNAAPFNSTSQIEQTQDGRVQADRAMMPPADASNNVAYTADQWKFNPSAGLTDEAPAQPNFALSPRNAAFEAVPSVPPPNAVLGAEPPAPQMQQVRAAPVPTLQLPTVMAQEQLAAAPADSRTSTDLQVQRESPPASIDYAEVPAGQYRPPQMEERMEARMGARMEERMEERKSFDASQSMYARTAWRGEDAQRQQPPQWLLDVNLAPRSSASAMQDMASRVVYGGRQVGLGMQLEKSNYDGSTYISRIVPGCAAQRSELRVGDLVISIDGIAITNRSLDQVKELCVGEEGSSSVVAAIRDYRRLSVRLTRTMPNAA